MKGTITASIMAAFGASLCCTGPAVLLLFGSTTFGVFSFLEPIRPYTTILAITILGYAYYRTFRKKDEEACCEIDKEKVMKKQKIQKWTLFGITPLVLALVLFPYYSGGLYAGGESNENNQKAGIVTEWKIEGMTCNGCAKGLQGGMSATKGINSCEVDYESKVMVCTVDEKIIEVGAIPGLVEKMGYKAVPIEKTIQERQDQTDKGTI